ncbi:Acyl-CoA N-acyltransferase [Penicillium angulare]|uniref:Acyl-CoA N-acyltransferase n=1 Tax=Penicillium angulare TaxID=116970 RepID=UPI00253F7719|nr:Acyl-CoA N-acyltransferase [Penicillium angulare]KAJ5266522.1 Acyl-CoA N-acyltransferase [Penicillium angulare]
MADNTPWTTEIQPPPGRKTKLSLPNQTTANPPVFNDAMIVRTRVFIDEQNCSPEGEIDSDDARSWQWVLYASESESESETTNPIAVIRLVPPPHPPHDLLTCPDTASASTGNLPKYDWVHEPCIKLTRVAVMPGYRGKGLGRRLVEIALAWASSHAREIDDAAAKLAAESNESASLKKWQGLVLVHAQVDVEKMYGGLGFQTDKELGKWDEEGIDHVGMFKRIDISH